MKLNPCPKCSSHRVRLGKIFPLHLLRLVQGSRRRYCCNCRGHWRATEKAFSPWARLSGILLMCAAAAATLKFLKDDGWFEPQPDMYQSAYGEDPGAAAADGEGMSGATGTRPGHDRIRAYSQSFAAGRSRAGRNFTRQEYMQLRGIARQVMSQNAAYPANGQGLLQQSGQSGNMQEILRRVRPRAGGKTPKELAVEIESSDKQTLWLKYGSNFSSQEEAASAFSEFKSRRNEVPDKWPSSPE